MKGVNVCLQHVSIGVSQVGIKCVEATTDLTLFSISHPTQPPSRILSFFNQIIQGCQQDLGLLVLIFVAEESLKSRN